MLKSTLNTHVHSPKDTVPSICAVLLKRRPDAASIGLVCRPSSMVTCLEQLLGHEQRACNVRFHPSCVPAKPAQLLVQQALV